MAFSFQSNIFKPLPSLTLGILSLIGAILCLFLPETLNRSLPVTLADGERFGEGERIFDFACFDRKGGKTDSTIVLPTH
jgi:MFS transporter, OCT family, solute carrier family 22 (organic cation transporter), member 4/5